MKLVSLEKFRMGFERVFIIGFGQMGRSIANTLRVNNFSGKIFASSRHKIEQYDYIDGNFNIEDCYDNYQNSIIFICVPPDLTAEIIEKMIEKTKNTNCIISDICSVKNNIFSNKKIIKNSNFVSIHPMDGGNSTEQKEFFKKYILNYIITNNLLNVNSDLLKQYDNFLHDFLNFENVKIDAKMHDKIVAITSHLPNLILASYYNNFSKIDNKMWKEIFLKNKRNISYFLQIFLKTIEQNIKNNNLENAIILAIKNIMFNEKIKIKKELFNPSLRAVFDIKSNSINKKNKINHEDFVENMHIFFEKLVNRDR